MISLNVKWRLPASRVAGIVTFWCECYRMPLPTRKDSVVKIVRESLQKWGNQAVDQMASPATIDRIRSLFPEWAGELENG